MVIEHEKLILDENLEFEPEEEYKTNFEILIPGVNTFPRDCINKEIVEKAKKFAKQIYKQKLKNKYNISDFRFNSLFAILYFYLFGNETVTLFELFRARLFKQKDSREIKTKKAIQFHLSEDQKEQLKRSKLFLNRVNFTAERFRNANDLLELIGGEKNEH